MKNLQESKRIKLNDNLEQTLHQIVDTFFKRVKRPVKKKTKIGDVKINLSDGTEGNVKVYIEPNMYSILGFDALAFMDAEDESNDPNRLYVSINPELNKDKTSLYNSLYHEFLHTTDPVFSSKYSEKLHATYDPDIDEKYWGHQIEFRAIAGEVLNALVNEFKIRKEEVSKKEQLNKLIESNLNILNHFANGEELSNLSLMIFKSMNKEPKIKSVLDKISREYPDTASLLPKPKTDLQYLDRYLLNLKKFSGDKWNKFLSMLYSTNLEISDMLSQE
jgi:hypothetical protein